MTSKLRGLLGAVLFGKELLDGKSPAEAKGSAREIMSELAPLVDPVVSALDDIQKQHQQRRERKPAAPVKAAKKDAEPTIIDTTGEEVPDEPPSRKPTARAIQRRRKG